MRPFNSLLCPFNARFCRDTETYASGCSFDASLGRGLQHRIICRIDLERSKGPQHARRRIVPGQVDAMRMNLCPVHPVSSSIGAITITQYEIFPAQPLLLH